MEWDNETHWSMVSNSHREDNVQILQKWQDVVIHNMEYQDLKNSITENRMMSRFMTNMSETGTQ